MGADLKVLVILATDTGCLLQAPEKQSWDRSVFSENDEQLLADDDDELDLEELEELEARIHKTAIDDT